jgi:hypothetical protein
VRIEHLLTNSSSKTVVILVAGLIGPDWQVECADCDSGAYNNNSWLLGMPCQPCDVVTNLQPGETLSLARGEFWAPASATAAVYKAGIGLSLNGHSCGVNAWTGQLNAVSQRIVLTNMNEEAQQSGRGNDR